MRNTADVVFTRARVAVFLDGCYWHGCPVHYKEPKSNIEYWRAKLARNRARDDQVDRLLADAGWTVIREWEHVDTGELADRVEQAVRVSYAPK